MSAAEQKTSLSEKAFYDETEVEVSEHEVNVGANGTRCE
jgi:hypothetical protein